MRKDRIEARLAAPGITQFEAAERAGKNAHFVYDFMIGRKRSFKGDGPVRVSTSGPFLPLAGIVEAGVYRRVGSTIAPRPPVDVPPRTGFPPAGKRTRGRNQRRELQYFPDRTELRAQSRTKNIKPIILKNNKTLERDGKVKVVAIDIEAILRL